MANDAGGCRDGELPDEQDIAGGEERQTAAPSAGPPEVPRTREISMMDPAFSSQDAGRRDSDTDQSNLLWQAARDGDLRGVKAALVRGADVHYIKKYNEDGAHVFKNRPLSASALHAAAACKGFRSSAPMSGRFVDVEGSSLGRFFGGAVIYITPNSWGPQIRPSNPAGRSTFKRSPIDHNSFMEVRPDKTMRHFRLTLLPDGRLEAYHRGSKWILQPLDFHHKRHSKSSEGAGAVVPDSSSPVAIVKLLLGAKAQLDAKAESVSEGNGQIREVTAIHLACAAGNVQLVRELVKLGARVDEPALFGGKPHYVPIHDAVWFRQRKTVECLLELRADVLETNKDGDTALHLAAKLGYADLVFFLLSNPLTSTALLTSQNRRGQIPLDAAVDGGRFPPRSLHLFTQNLDHHEKASAFLKVAHRCPSAAAALLRTTPMWEHTIVDRKAADDSDEDECSIDYTLGPIAGGWCQSLQHGAKDGTIGADTLALLIKKAPRAALDLLDALAHRPEERSKDHYPLPIRARVPALGGPWPVSFAYEPESLWEWSPSCRGREWHSKLCVEDPKEGAEVQIRVVDLIGIVNLDVLLALSVTADECFTKIVVHALLGFVWDKVRLLHLIRFAHTCLSLLALHVRVVRYDSLSGSFWSATVSCILMSQASFGLLTSAWTMYWAHFCCKRASDRRWLVRRCVTRSMLSILMVVAMWDGSSTQGGSLDLVLWALAVVLQWLSFLISLRAFTCTGRIMLPISKSISPVAGMLVIMAALLLGWCHAFWAMDDCESWEARTLQFEAFLLAGEPFIIGSEIARMEDFQKVVMVALILTALLFFLGCALNIFIAVLGDCYDVEQERSVSTFLKERAKICTTLLHGPRVPADHPMLLRSIKPGLFLVVLPCFIMFFIRACFHQDESAWCVLASMTLAIGIFLMEVSLRGAIMAGWESRYLWLCHDRNFEEEAAGLHPELDAEHSGDCRMGRIKRAVYEQSRIRKKETTASLQQCKTMLSSATELQRDATQHCRDLACRQERLEEKMNMFCESHLGVLEILSELRGKPTATLKRRNAKGSTSSPARSKTTDVIKALPSPDAGEALGGDVEEDAAVPCASDPPGGPADATLSGQGPEAGEAASGPTASAETFPKAPPKLLAVPAETRKRGKLRATPATAQALSVLSAPPGKGRQLWIQGCIGRHSAVNGMYFASPEPHQGRTCWASNGKVPCYLFHTGRSRWVIARQLGDINTCLAYLKDGGLTSSPAHCVGAWMICCEGGTWQPESALACVEQLPSN